MPFQRDGVLYGLRHRGRVLIGDEMGIGKTVQAIAVACAYKVALTSIAVSPVLALVLVKLELCIVYPDPNLECCVSGQPICCGCLNSQYVSLPLKKPVDKWVMERLDLLLLRSPAISVLPMYSLNQKSDCKVKGSPETLELYAQNDYQLCCKAASENMPCQNARFYLMWFSVHHSNPFASRINVICGLITTSHLPCPSVSKEVGSQQC